MHGNFSYWEGVCLLSGAEAERQRVVQPAAGNTLDRQNPGASDSLRAAIETVPGDSRDVWALEA